MKGKYITLNIMMACTKKRTSVKKNIHEQLDETISERKRIMEHLDRHIQTARMVEMILTNKKAA
ncbi:hypothetical protein [Terrimonas pollutisoli]|uniref:hypothetical protein n=1 Tax=Terrimonas pollutisoli TaxID=3034147 RepID=UPI0023EB835B|nr:hypothetical protein [Terrimonas sp. H1YJ31]